METDHHDGYSSSILTYLVVDYCRLYVFVMLRQWLQCLFHLLTYDRFCPFYRSYCCHGDVRSYQRHTFRNICEQKVSINSKACDSRPQANTFSAFQLFYISKRSTDSSLSTHLSTQWSWFNLMWWQAVCPNQRGSGPIQPHKMDTLSDVPQRSFFRFTLISSSLFSKGLFADAS